MKFRPQLIPETGCAACSHCKYKIHDLKLNTFDFYCEIGNWRVSDKSKVYKKQAWGTFNRFLSKSPQFQKFYGYCKERNIE